MRLWHGILYTTGAQFAIQVLGLVSGVLVARWLGPEGRGELAAIIGWVSVLAYVGNLGQPAALAYAAARDETRWRELFGNSILVCVCQWLVLSTLAALILPLLLGRFGSDASANALYYVLAFLPLNFLTLCSISILQGVGRIEWFSLVRVSVPLAYVAGLFGCSFLDELSVESVLLVHIASNVVALVLALTGLVPVLLRDAFPRRPWVNLASLPGDLRYGLAAHVGALQPFSGMRLDILALSLIASAHDLGLYAAALAAAGVLQAQGVALGHVVLPAVAKAADARESIRLIRKFVLIAAVGGCIAWLVVMLMAKEMIWLVYGQSYVGADALLKVVVLGGAIAAAQRVLADGARGMGLPWLSSVAEAASLLAGLLGLFLLVPRFGPMGAAVAVTAASAISFTLLACMMRSKLGSDAPVKAAVDLAA